MDQTHSTTHRWQTIAEMALIFAIFFLHGAFPVPDSNEAHYLAKAKHYWNPDWAAGDFFLESADAHQVFYWTFGWLTLWFSLPQVAWIGRVLTWALLAIGWQRLSFAVVPLRWMSLLSAAAFVGLNENAHMAGEWVVGGIEAKGFAYALVLFALSRMVRQQWGGAWVLLGLATLMHVLVGGWAMIAAGIAWMATQFPTAGPASRVTRSLTRTAGQASSGAPADGARFPFAAVVVAVVLAAPSVYLGLSLSRSAGPEVIAEANRIYVFERLSHHLIALNLAPGFLTRQLLLQGAWFLMITYIVAPSAGQRALRWFVATTIAVCWLGLLLTMLLSTRLDLLASLMRYYWFRASDVFVPLGVAIELCLMISALWPRRAAAAKSWLGAAIVLAAVDTTNQIDHLPFHIPYLHESLPAPRADKNVKYDDWRDACDWLLAHTEANDRVLAPRNAATLKWYTGRPEVANWKDVPQDAASIVEWWRRMQALHGTGKPDARWYASFSEQGALRLAALMETYQAQYVIVTLREDLEPLPVEPLYQNGSYAVYRREQLVTK